MGAESINLYTIGYQGMSIELFLEMLRVNKIELIIDIREKPFSRNRDFSRKNLINHLTGSNIEYIHLKQLGSPQKLRDQVRSDHDYDNFFKQYADYLNSQSETLTYLYNLMIDKTVCLLCFEKDPQTCHRKIVAEKLAEKTGDSIRIQIINL